MYKANNTVNSCASVVPGWSYLLSEYGCLSNIFWVLKNSIPGRRCGSRFAWSWGMPQLPSVAWPHRHRRGECMRPIDSKHPASWVSCSIFNAFISDDPCGTRARFAFNHRTTRGSQNQSSIQSCAASGCEMVWATTSLRPENDSNSISAYQPITSLWAWYLQTWLGRRYE